MRAESVLKHRRFVAAGIDNTPIGLSGSSSSATGDSDFVGAALRLGCQSARGADLTEVPRASCRPQAPSLAEFHAHESDRVVAMAHAYSTGGYTMRGISMQFRVRRTTVAKAVCALKSLQAVGKGDDYRLETKRLVST